MAQIITEDGTRLVDGVSQPRPGQTARRPPPTTADPRADRADRNVETSLRLARAL